VPFLHSYLGGAETHSPRHSDSLQVGCRDLASDTKHPHFRSRSTSCFRPLSVLLREIPSPLLFLSQVSTLIQTCRSTTSSVHPNIPGRERPVQYRPSLCCVPTLLTPRSAAQDRPPADRAVMRKDPRLIRIIEMAVPDYLNFIIITY
jgi:hypothetical protein